ncbi:hypothetical protein M2318_003237 [Metapseudomonas resinovorans]
MLAAARLDACDEEVGQGQGFFPQGLHVGLGEAVEAALHQGQGGDRLGPAEVTADARRRLVARFHAELAGVAPPAGQRLPDQLAQGRRHPDEGRRTGAAIQVLVGATDGVVSAGGLDVDRHGSGGVAQVPDGQGAAFVGQGGERGHVVQVAGLVVDLGDQHYGGVGADGGRQLLGAVRQAQAVALLQHVGQAFGHVEVGGEVAGLADYHLACRVALGLHPQSRHQHLEQVDGGGIGDHHFVLAGTDQAGQLIAQALGQAAPAGAVPATDQAFAPLLLHQLAGPFQGRLRTGAEGIAVQVDHPFGQDEIVPQRGKGVAGIKGQAVFSCSHCRFLDR